MALLKIFKGDDTGGTFGRSLTFTLTIAPGTPTEGCRAEFEFDGIVKVFAAPIVSGETREIIYTHAETASMSLGTRTAIFRLIDAQGRIRTLDNTVRVCVTDIVSEVYPGSSTATVVIGTTITWEDISGKPLLVKTINGVPPDASGNALVAAGGTVKSATINGGAKINPDESGNLPLVVPNPTFDDTVTQSSSNGVKSSGIWSWVKSLLPNWLTPTFGEPYTKTATDTLLAEKANATHTHAQSDVTGLGDALAAKRDKTDMFTEWTATGSAAIGHTVTVDEYHNTHIENPYSYVLIIDGVSVAGGGASTTPMLSIDWSDPALADPTFDVVTTRQRILTTGDVDATPTSGHTNPVQSGGVATALADKLTKNAPGGGYSIGWDGSNRLSLNGYLMATGIGATEVYDDGNRVLTSHQDISGKANVSDFALPSGGGAPSAGYVSSLFTSANTSFDAANMNYTADGETPTTVKAKIQSIETAVGAAASSLSTALGTSAE